MSLRGRHPDIWIAGMVLALAGVMHGATYWFDAVPAALMQGLGADVFPRLVLATIAVLALVLAWQARRRAPPALPALPPTVWATVAAMVGFMAALELVGMLAALAIFLVGLGWLWGERRWPALLASAAGIVGFLWLVFVRFFGIPLPRGLVL